MATRTVSSARQGPCGLGRKQAGLSFLGWTAILAVAAIFASVGLKTIPHYLENQTIVGVLESMDPKLMKSGSKKKVFATLNKRLKINNVRGVTGSDILEYKRAKDANYWVLDYEVREKVVANLDLVIAFNKELR